MEVDAITTGAVGGEVRRTGTRDTVIVISASPAKSPLKSPTTRMPVSVTPSGGAILATPSDPNTLKNVPCAPVSPADQGWTPGVARMTGVNVTTFATGNGLAPAAAIAAMATERASTTVDMSSRPFWVA